MSRILVLLDRHQQPLLIKCLNIKHEVFAPDSATSANSPVEIANIPFDLCILDEATFHRIGQLIETVKTASVPLFLPFLLVSKGRNSADTDLPFILTPEQLEGRIDDLLLSPFPPTELHFRVENLLARRQLSLELHRIQEVVKERNLAENVLIASLQASNENLQREIDKRVEVEATLRSNSYLDSLMN
ncbi:PAS domain-containing sensor histidine kinase, partial [Microcoleus anatoxicus PTRS2]